MLFLLNGYFSKYGNTSSTAGITKATIHFKTLFINLLNGQGFWLILIFKTTSLPHQKRTAGESCTIRSTFKRLLDQHWLGIRKDQGQTEDICKGNLFVHWSWCKRTFKNQAGSQTSVPCFIFVVTKGKDSRVVPKLQTLSTPKSLSAGEGSWLSQIAWRCRLAKFRLGGR